MNEELKVIISAEISNLKKNVADAQKEVKTFSQRVKDAKGDVEKNFKDIGNKIGDGIKKGVKAAATALAAVGAALVALGPATAEYRAEQAKLVTAFETAGSSAGVAKDVYNDLYRVLGDSGVSVEAANHLAQLTTEEKALSEWTNICQGVYATFGDSIPIEGLTEAVNETAKVGEVTGSLADALNWAGISEDDFNAKLEKCASTQEREKLIRETLNGVYDEAAANYEKNAEAILAQNEANARMQENMAKLGEVMAPVITAFTNFGNELLEKIIPTIQSLAEEYGPQLNDALSKMADFIGQSVSWVVDNWEIIAGIAGVLAGIAAAIGLYNAVAAVKAAMDAAQVTTLGALIAAYAAQAAAMVVAIAPYLLIVAAIAAVIAIIVLCVKHWDEIKAKVKEVWGKIKDWTKETVDKVVNWFNNLKEKTSQIVENIKTSISDKFQAAKDKVVSIVENIKSGIQEKLTAAKNTVSNILDNIKTKFTTIFDNAKTIVKNAIDKIKSFFNFKWELPKIKLPHFSISGKFSLNPPSIPKFSVSWYQKGGVFDNPTLFGYGGRIGGLGENGAEAIVPLEKNTQWLDRIATMLNQKMGGGSPIVLQVDGKTFAQISVDSINQLTRQRGSLPLNLV